MVIQPNLVASEFAADMKTIVTSLVTIKNLFEKHANRLTEIQRKRMPKPRDGLINVAPAFMRAVEAHPEVAKAAQVDALRVNLVLNALDALNPAVQTINQLVTLFADTKLTWRGWLENQLLLLYGIAKVVAASDPSLQEVVNEIAPTFPGHHGATAPNNPAPPAPPSTESTK